MRLFDPDNPLAIEIQEEKTAAYFEACRKMVDSLEELKSFDSDSSGTPKGKQRIGERSKLIEAVTERVYFVIIQREAIQLTGIEKFLEDYQVPEEVKTRLGYGSRRVDHE